jgi:mono/diheme cytochrome c family protein
MAMYEKLLFAFCAGLVVIALSGCGEDRPAERTVQKVDTTPDDDKKVKVAEVGDPEAGKQTYAVFCVSCHGNTGKGDGPAGAALPVKPSDLTDGKDVNAESDEFLFTIIKQGGASVGKSALMTPWGGQLTDQEIWNLVSYIRNLAIPPYQPPQ